MNKTKPITLPSGARLTHGQIIGDPTMKPNQGQRPLNSSYGHKIGRDGRVTKTAETETIAIKPGMKRQTRGELHPYLHGTALQDEPNIPLKSHEKRIPIHGGMTDKQRAKVDPVVNNPNVILKDAANLGKKA